MKQHILIFPFLLLSLFSKNASGQTCKVKVFFGNGIDTTRGNANISRALLEKRLREKFPDIKVNLAYNETTDFVSDLSESVGQVASQHSKDIMAWINGSIQDSRYAPDWVKSNSKSLSKKAEENLSKFNNINTEDLKNHVDFYSKTLSNKEGVFIVAHSQGNLYANEARIELNKQYQLSPSNFRIFGVGTPADNVGGIKGGNAPYITNHLDIIGSVLTALQPNWYLKNADKTDIDNGLVDRTKKILSTKFHNFSDTYLSSSYDVLPQIMYRVSQQLEEMGCKPCEDKDGDGHPDSACGGDDCDDNDKSKWNNCSTTSTKCQKDLYYFSGLNQDSNTSFGIVPKGFTRRKSLFIRFAHGCTVKGVYIEPKEKRDIFTVTGRPGPYIVDGSENGTEPRYIVSYSPNSDLVSEAYLNININDNIHKFTLSGGVSEPCLSFIPKGEITFNDIKPGCSLKKEIRIYNVENPKCEKISKITSVNLYSLIDNNGLIKNLKIGGISSLPITLSGQYTTIDLIFSPQSPTSYQLDLEIVSNLATYSIPIILNTKENGKCGN